jgi:hypothetical protein
MFQIQLIQESLLTPVVASLSIYFVIYSLYYLLTITTYHRIVNE